MTLKAFNALDINSHAFLLWNYRPLDERRDAEHTILLYRLPNFYAEVWYHWGDNRIVNIRAFNPIQELSTYLPRPEK